MKNTNQNKAKNPEANWIISLFQGICNFIIGNDSYDSSKWKRISRNDYLLNQEVTCMLGLVGSLNSLQKFYI